MNDTLNQYKFELTKISGEVEAITYSLPPLRRIGDYIDSTISYEAQFAFITGMTVEEMDAFEDQSVYDLLDRVAQQMDPRLAAWIDRTSKRVAKLKGQHESLGLIPNTGTGFVPKSSLQPDTASPKSQT
jgi:hypothetical protein